MTVVNKTPRLVFFLEELSAKAFLEELLPRIVPEPWSFVFVVFEGKQDMHKELPRKLRGWKGAGDRLVILRDQDSGDCRIVKNSLRLICTEAGKHEALVRVACRQLEAWYVADWPGMARAFDRPNLARLAAKAKYREPDMLGDPYREIKREVSAFQKVSGARRMGRHISLARSSSTSFLVFLNGINRLMLSIDNT